MIKNESYSVQINKYLNMKNYKTKDNYKNQYKLHF